MQIHFAFKVHLAQKSTLRLKDTDASTLMQSCIRYVPAFLYSFFVPALSFSDAIVR